MNVRFDDARERAKQILFNYALAIDSGKRWSEKLSGIQQNPGTREEEHELLASFVAKLRWLGELIENGHRDLSYGTLGEITKRLPAAWLQSPYEAAGVVATTAHELAYRLAIGPVFFAIGGYESPGTAEVVSRLPPAQRLAVLKEIASALAEMPPVDIKRWEWMINREWAMVARESGNESGTERGLPSERKQDGNIFDDDSDRDLPTEPDLRSLWILLFEGQGKNKSEAEIATEFNPALGISMLKTLRTRRERKRVSDWRKQKTERKQPH